MWRLEREAQSAARNHHPTGSSDYWLGWDTSAGSLILPDFRLCLLRIQCLECQHSAGWSYSSYQLGQWVPRSRQVFHSLVSVKSGIWSCPLSTQITGLSSKGKRAEMLGQSFKKCQIGTAITYLNLSVPGLTVTIHLGISLFATHVSVLQQGDDGLLFILMFSKPGEHTKCLYQHAVQQKWTSNFMLSIFPKEEDELSLRTKDTGRRGIWSSWEMGRAMEMLPFVLP